MAILVPSREEIDSLPQSLTDGERALMNALLLTLGDDWTIYVQPHLNGLRPDIVIFNESAGVGIFEVKDWDLNAYSIVNGSWEVKDAATGQWVALGAHDCPLRQVEKYKDSLIKHELPLISAYKALASDIYALVVPFVYFHRHNTRDVQEKLTPILSEHSNAFGCDSTTPTALRRMLDHRHLRSGSRFAGWMKETEFAERLANALAYPRHGDTDINSLLVAFNEKQRNLLPNMPGRRRALGAAGSGKTLLLVHKAVDAAMLGQRVLLVCFNITMSNYLRDLTTRLARYYGPHHHRQIEVAHFHRLFPDEGNSLEDSRYMKIPVDVLLIDEGQDFERPWLDALFSICSHDHHVLLVEDDRQNIYGRDMASRRSIPGIRGRPNLLNESFRLPPMITSLANGVVEWSGMDNEAGPIQCAKPLQTTFLTRTQWVECDGDVGAAVLSLKSKLSQARGGSPTVARPDIAILTCTTAVGWQVCEMLDELRLPYQRTFESRAEDKRLRDMYWDDSCRDDDNCVFKQKRRELRRAYKAAFWMQGGRIKVSTVHSFKGWELAQIHVVFSPDQSQDDRHVQLLYTAITRAQEELVVYNADVRVSEFGEMASRHGLVSEYQSTGDCLPDEPPF